MLFSLFPLAPPFVDGINPTTGPVWGNTTVTVMGNYFRNSDELYCLFGTHPRLRGQFISITHVLCVSPQDTGPTTMPLEITNNNQDFTTNGVVFEYQGWYCIIYN